MAKMDAWWKNKEKPGKSCKKIGKIYGKCGERPDN